jgi:U2 snRNP auxiliary factor large subunit
MQQQQQHHSFGISKGPNSFNHHQQSQHQPAQFSSTSSSNTYQQQQQPTQQFNLQDFQFSSIQPPVSQFKGDFPVRKFSAALFLQIISHSRRSRRTHPTYIFPPPHKLIHFCALFISSYS